MTHHPCPYSDTLLPTLVEACAGVSPIVNDVAVLLDPMAGSGKAAVIADRCGYRYVGVEIEQEWADEHPATICGDSTDLSWFREQYGFVELIVTSPAYGGRFADQYLGTPAEQLHRAETGEMPRRRSYAISLGRRLSKNSGAGTAFNRRYKLLHMAIIRECFATLAPGGRMVVNVSNFIKDHSEVHVVDWWRAEMVDAGFVEGDVVPVGTRRFKDGANRDARVAAEYVITYTKPRDAA